MVKKSELERGLQYLLKKHSGQARTATHTQKPSSITVVLSGRPKDGGHTVRFEHTVRTISALEADIEAMKEARAAGLTSLVVLDRIFS